MSSITWRFLLSGPQEPALSSACPELRRRVEGPALNMAIDEALLLRCKRESSSPVLRLYTWNPPALSLGRFQKASEEIDLEACRRRGIPIVRRPTGGKAILHNRDLTYSVVGPTSIAAWGKDILETYRMVSEALATGLRQLGVAAKLQPVRKQNPRESALLGACALFPASHEILVEGKKLVGSAQKRLRRSFLQHGSIPVFSNVETNLELFLGAEQTRGQDRSLWREKSTALCEQLPTPPTFEELAKAIAGGFREFFRIDLAPSELSSEELDQARELVRLKYARQEWNLQGLESICPV